MNDSFRKIGIVLIIILVATSVRLSLFYSGWGNIRHSQSNAWASAAIASYYGENLSTNKQEMSKIGNLKSIRIGKYNEFYENESKREPFTIMLPGLSILLAFLWKIFGLFNYTPLIFFQIILDVFTIVLFYLFVDDIDNKIKSVLILFLIINLASIKRVLMASYDFYPSFVILVSFISLYMFIKNPRKIYWLIIIGILNSLIIWIRSITIFFPIFIIVYLILSNFRRRKTKAMIIQIIILLIPFIFSIYSLSMYRGEITGNNRPMRTPLWHSFFGGGGQFSNPYGIVSKDVAIMNWAKNQNKSLRVLKGNLQNQMIYESFLKEKAIGFVKRHPVIFIRNTFYRTFIMISPLLYKDDEFIPQKIKNICFILGFLLLPFWFLGLNSIFKENKPLFFASAIIYLYFFFMFSWFYIVGRIMLSFLFLNIIYYLYGLKFVIIKLKLQK